MLISLKLKPNIFKDILSFKKELYTLQDEDFASPNEIGSNFLLTFFAYNQITATLLYLKLYANLIANQDFILEVGGIPVLESGVKLIEKINLKKHVSQKNETSYKASTRNILMREDVFRMVFKKSI